MATRAHIRIYYNDKSIMLYHHCDGYPEGIGSDLKKVVDEIYKNDIFAVNKLIKGELIANDSTYELTDCLHGDEEYVYVIDCRDKTIKCFRRSWNDSFEDCFKAEREELIP